MITAAQNSPVYRFVKLWRLALPLHPEFRTLPMLFYVPPMLPVIARVEGGRYDVDGANGNGDGSEASSLPSISNLDQARVPLRYMASLFSAGNEEIVAEVYRKLIAVRVHMREKKVGNIPSRARSSAALDGGRHDARGGGGDLPPHLDADVPGALRAARRSRASSRSRRRRPVPAQAGDGVRHAPGRSGGGDRPRVTGSRGRWQRSSRTSSSIRTGRRHRRPGLRRPRARESSEAGRCSTPSR